MEELQFEDLINIAAFINDNGNAETSMKYMLMAVEKNAALDSYEQECFIQPFRRITKDLRNQIRACTAELSAETLESESLVIAFELMKKDLTEQLVSYCKQVISILKDKVLPAITEDIEKPKLHLFIGDFARYIAESESDEAAEMAALSHDNYALALTMTAELLPAAHPIRLNSALNLSILLSDIMDKYDDALELLQTIHNEAINQVGDLEPEDQKVAQEILAKMLESIVEWSGAE